MSRYHKKVYIPDKFKSQLKTLTDIINTSNWRYTSHALDNIKHRAIDLKEVLEFIKEIKLYAEQVFEFYADSFDFIYRICYRVPYNKDIDLILVIGEGKKLITIYFNTKDDEHYTLNKELYTKS